MRAQTAAVFLLTALIILNCSACHVEPDEEATESEIFLPDVEEPVTPPPPQDLEPAGEEDDTEVEEEADDVEVPVDYIRVRTPGVWVLRSIGDEYYDIDLYRMEESEETPGSAAGMLDGPLLSRLIREAAVATEFEVELSVFYQMIRVEVLALPDDAELAATCLRSVWATIQDNDTDYRTVRFFQDGKPLSYPGIQWNRQGEIEGERIMDRPLTEEEAQAVDDSFAYVAYNLTELPPPTEFSSRVREYIILDDPTSRMLTNFIANATCYNIPETGFAEPSEADSSFVTMAGILNSQAYGDWTLTMNHMVDKPDNVHALRKIRGRFYNSSTVILADHVERSARRVLGDGVAVEHGDIFVWHYVPGVLGNGIYVPADRGVVYVTFPVVLDYQEYGDRYEVEAIFLKYGGGYLSDDGLIADEDLEAYCLTAPRDRIVLMKQQDCSLLYWSHQRAE